MAVMQDGELNREQGSAGCDFHRSQHSDIQFIWLHVQKVRAQRVGKLQRYRWEAKHQGWRTPQGTDGRQNSSHSVPLASAGLWVADSCVVGGRCGVKDGLRRAQQRVRQPRKEEGGEQQLPHVCRCRSERWRGRGRKMGWAGRARGTPPRRKVPLPSGAGNSQPHFPAPLAAGTSGAGQCVLLWLAGIHGWVHACKARTGVTGKQAAVRGVGWLVGLWLGGPLPSHCTGPGCRRQCKLPGWLPWKRRS